MRLFKRWSIATAAGPWPSMPWPHQRSNSVERLLFLSLEPQPEGGGAKLQTKSAHKGR